MVINMKDMTIQAVATAVEGELHLPGCTGGGFDSTEGGCDSDAAGKIAQIEAESVVINSRKCTANSIFIATKGEKVDGHSFIGKVFKAGALCVICERMPEGTDAEGNVFAAGPYIIVKDSFEALKKLAAYYRSRLDVKIVGIVGSVGKTSTKELVASVLKQHADTLKTEGNFNNEIGVPLTLLNIRENHRMAVVEMGISDFGEMDRLGRMVRPDAVVMTNIGPCHLEFLGDLDGVLRAKSEVFRHIKKGGLLVLNNEDAKLCTVKSVEGVDIVRYGRDGAVSASGAVSRGLEGTEFDIDFADSATAQTGMNFEAHSLHAFVPLPGSHMVLNALAAAAVASSLGLSDDEIRLGLANVEHVAGRNNLIHTEKYLVVDDCYNANPKSMCNAVDIMKYALSRRCAIFGDMFELGEKEKEFHSNVGRYAAEGGIDLLICAGELSKCMYDEFCTAAPQKSALWFKNTDELLENFEKLPFEKGDTIIIKASHGMKFVKIVDKFSET